MGVNIGIYYIQDVQGNCYDCRKIPVFLKYFLSLYQTGIIQILVLIRLTRQTLFVGIAVGVVSFVVPGVSVNSGSQRYVNNRHFPIPFVISLSEPRQDSRIKSGFGRTQRVDRGFLEVGAVLYNQVTRFGLYLTKRK